MKRFLGLASAALLLAVPLAYAQGSAAKPTTPAKAAAPATPAKAVTAAAARPATTPAAATHAAVAKPAATPAIDLNSASKEELMKLPGIGEAIAAKIVAGRPWTNKAQLLSKGLVTKAAYDKFAGSVVAKQAK